MWSLAMKNFMRFLMPSMRRMEHPQEALLPLQEKPMKSHKDGCCAMERLSLAEHIMTSFVSW